MNCFLNFLFIFLILSKFTNEPILQFAHLLFSDISALEQSFTGWHLHVPLFVHFHHKIRPMLWTFSDEFADKFVHKVEANITFFLIECPAFPSWLPFHFLNYLFDSVPFHLEMFAFVVKNVFAIKDCSRIQALTFQKEKSI